MLVSASNLFQVFTVQWSRADSTCLS